MDTSRFVELDAPRFENGRTLLIAGLGERYSFETNQGIPFQWQRFRPYIGNIPAQVGSTSYGVCCNSDGSGHFEYIAGMEVSSFAGLPGELSRIRIPEQKYAVFSHRDHISKLRSSVYTIWNKWLPEFRSRARRFSRLRTLWREFRSKGWNWPGRDLAADQELNR